MAGSRTVLTSLSIKELQRKHLEEALSNAKPRKSAPISASKKSGIDYNVALQQLVLAVKKQIDEKVIPLLRRLASEYVADSWDDDIGNIFNEQMDLWTGTDFSSRANRVAQDFVVSADAVHRKRFQEQMKRIGIDVFGQSPKISDYLQAAASSNVRLIESIPAEYLGKVRTLVEANMRAGRPPGAIVTRIQEQFGVAKSRAKLIARDQTNKINSELTERRQREVGFEYFQWVSSHDERVRHDHQVIANRVTEFGKGVYRWDDPPKNDRGETITPGSDYQCRCTARPLTKAQIGRV